MKGLGKFAARARYRRVSSEWQCPKCFARVPVEFMGRTYCLRCEAEQKAAECAE